MLTFDTACAWGALGKAYARAIAARLASLGRDLPEAAVAPDVEDVLARAVVAAGKLPRRPLAITGPPGGRLSIDGRAAGCALPCTVDVLAGDRVIAADTDGFAPAARTVRTPDTAQLALAQPPASPELAAQQWQARVGRGLPPTDLVGAALLGRLAGQARIALVHGGDPLSGALVIDGVLRASAVRPRDEAAPLVREPGIRLPRARAALAVGASVVLDRGQRRRGRPRRLRRLRDLPAGHHDLRGFPR